MENTEVQVNDGRLYLEQNDIEYESLLLMVKETD